MAAKNARKKRRCQAKIGYEKSTEAMTAAYFFNHRHTRRVWSYKCSFCGKFHNGKPNSKAIQSVRSRHAAASR